MSKYRQTAVDILDKRMPQIDWANSPDDWQLGTTVGVVVRAVECALNVARLPMSDDEIRRRATTALDFTPSSPGEIYAFTDPRLRSAVMAVVRFALQGVHEPLGASLDERLLAEIKAETGVQGTREGQFYAVAKRAYELGKADTTKLMSQSSGRSDASQDGRYAD